MHPAGDIRGAKGNALANRKIVMCITGSIAAVECVKLARELVRHGADVHAVMTEWACDIIGPSAMEFATGNPVVTKLTGMVEHVTFCGDVEDRADLVLVAPATANTIGKMVHAIDDTPVTTYLTTAIGTGIPVMVVPAMHNTMYSHSVVRENLEKAGTMGIDIIQPILEERKAKMAGIDEIVENVIRRLSTGFLKGKKVLVVEGATREPIDDIRYLSNRATGRTGNMLARVAFRRGADVMILAGENVNDLPDHIESGRFSDTDDLLMRIESISKNGSSPDICYFVAGISDYKPQRKKGKIASGKGDMTLKLNPTPKVIRKFRDLNPDTFLVGFKAESVSEDRELIMRAFERMKEVGMDLVVANDLSDVTESSNTVLTITPTKEVFKASGKKEHLARFIMDKTVERLNVKRGS
jgi:phosphopantothenoylcysteine decarboxylase/phosphopantothenate--cysteine ligase